MADQVIPLTSAPNQTLTVSLAIDGGVKTLQLTISFNEMSQYWVMKVADQNGNVLLNSIPFLTGDFPAANVLAQHTHLKIGSAYVVNAGNVQSDYPGQRDLGTGFFLVWSDTPSR